MNQYGIFKRVLTVAVCLCASGVAQAADRDVDASSACSQLPSQGALRKALAMAVNHAGGNGGFGLNMWGHNRQSRWRGVRSRVYGK